MRPLRVAHLVTTLGVGGAQRQEVALAERLPRDRFRLDFLALGGPGEYDERARAAGARVYHLGTRWAPGEGRVLGYRRRLGRGVAYLRAARRGRYDIVDAWLYPDDALAAVTRWLTGVPIVISGRRNLHPHDRLGPIAGPLDRVVDRLTDAVVANSEAAARFAVAAHHADPAKVRVIHNGVEPIVALAPEERRAWRARFGAGDDDLVIGCVGRCRPVKRQELLVDALARLAPGNPGLRLVIVGDGELRDDLARQASALGIADRVRLHGSELDPRPLYGAFDIVAQASRSEGLPNVLLEAAAAGRPIVATDAGGTSEIVLDGRTGILVPVEDVDALATGLGRVAADASLRRRLGEAARAHVEERFGMDRFAAEYAALYEELAAARGLPGDGVPGRRAG